MRKASLEKLLYRRPDGIFTGSFEQGEIGLELFRQACLMGLEGLVSKRANRPYRGGRSNDWIKTKNRARPAMEASGKFTRLKPCHGTNYRELFTAETDQTVNCEPSYLFQIASAK